MASGRKYQLSGIILVTYDIRLYFLISNDTRFVHYALAPLAACYWPQVVTWLLPSGMFHLISHGHPLLT